MQHDSTEIRGGSSGPANKSVSTGYAEIYDTTEQTILKIREHYRRAVWRESLCGVLLALLLSYSFSPRGAWWLVALWPVVLAPFVLLFVRWANGRKYKRKYGGTEVWLQENANRTFTGWRSGPPFFH